MKKFGRYILTILLGALIIGVGLVIGGVHKDLEAISESDPGANYFSSEMPRFQDTRPSPLGKDLTFNDMPMEVAYFETDKSVKEVSDFYLKSFKGMKLQAYSETGDGWGRVYGNDIQRKVQRLVVVQRQSGRTFVFPSIVPLFALPSFEMKQSGDVFVVEGATGYSEISSKEYGKGSRMIVYMSPKGPAESALQMAEGMKKLGWSRGQDLPGRDDSKVMDFSREGGRAVVMLMAQKGGGTSVIMNVQGGKKQ